jgi:GNAT superfamily N-acetyltransferase
MENIKIYPISGDDIINIVDLWNRVLLLDEITINTFISKVILDENFDENNVLVAKNNDLLIGFIIGATVKAKIYKEIDPDNIRSWITCLVIDPKFQKKGIGEWLVNTLLDHFKMENKKECYIATYPYGYFTPGIDMNAYPEAISFFKSLGFEEKYRPLSMDSNIVLINFHEMIDQKIHILRQDGIEIIPFEKKFILSYIGFMKKFMPFDWLRVARNNLVDMTKGSFNEDQIFIAMKGSEVIGYCQFEGSHFGPFGVSDAYQGKGIGTVLLAKTLERMRMKGYHNTWVMWTDDLAAKVYGKFGFKETRRFVVMGKTI